jgi:DNA-directed RNA polymerase specialized sigma24 family protein
MERRGLARLRRLLNHLTPIERDALRRYYALEQSAEEIEAAIGVTESQLKDLKARIRKALAEKT